MENVTRYDINESHPLLPSGEWEGFYTYAFGAAAPRHQMAFTLEFWNGIISGHGSDELDVFSWRGSYDKKVMSCKITKSYYAYSVHYEGYIDENGIWGTWTISEKKLKGGFHIWHKRKLPF